MSNADEPAYPSHGTMGEIVSLGLTKREHAAILLRVPKSGDDDIDAMIREASRRDAVVMVMQGYLSALSHHPSYERKNTIENVTEITDALLAELEKTG